MRGPSGRPRRAAPAAGREGQSRAHPGFIGRPRRDLLRVSGLAGLVVHVADQRARARRPFLFREKPTRILRLDPTPAWSRSRVVTEFYRQYLAVAVFVVAAFGMVGAMLAIARILRPTLPQDEKYITYESGSDPLPLFGQANVRYYIYALLFVIFDVEAVFIFPWAIDVDGAALVRADRDDRVRRSCCCSGSRTSGARGCSSGPDQLRQVAQAAHVAPQLQPQVLAVDVPVGPGVLRDRDGRRARRPALRRDAPRRHPVPGEPAPGRPDRHLGHRHRQDGARDQAALRADARPEVRHLDGLVRELRRSLLGLVLGHEGRRPDHPGRRVRARVARRGPRRSSRAS